MSDDLDPVLLAKWVAHQLSTEDQRALASWLAADPAHLARLNQYGEIWRKAGEIAEARNASADSAEAVRWKNVLRAIGQERELDFPFDRHRARWQWPVAAAAVLAAAVGLTLIADRMVRSAPPAVRTYETRRGERAEFRLSDGTLVMLHVASRLQVPVDYSKTERSVRLEGEAYFDVAHDDRRPFRVHAGPIAVEDIGTAFSVRTYPADGPAQVVVRVGQVLLRAAAATGATGSVKLGPGQLGQLDSTGRPVVQPVDTAAEFAWIAGTLVLDGIPLLEALPRLGSWFDLDFRLSDSSLGRIPVAATLTNQPTDEALSFLAASLGLQEARQGRIVTFYPASPRR